MKETKKLYSVRIYKNGVVFKSYNGNSEYFLDFKNKLNLKQFKIGS